MRRFLSGITTSTLQVTGGTPAANRVLLSDATGNASWGVIPRYALNVVANNASILEKAAADYQCDGTNDAVEIQAAIDTGRPVQLSSGTFSCGTTSINLEGSGTVSSPNLYFRAAGMESTVLSFTSGTDGIIISECAKVNVGDFQVSIGGAATGVKAIAGTGDTKRSFWQSDISRINVVGDFSSHSGWAFDFQNPFRSSISLLFAVGVKNGLYLRSTDSGFNPGNCTFTNCFMELNIANGTGYKLHSIDTGGNLNILSFIECDTQDSATSTTSVGWHFIGSTTTYYRTKDIRVNHTNTESFNTPFKLEYAENIDIDANYVSVEGDGTVFDTNSSCISNNLRVGNLFINSGQTVKILNDLNSDTSHPNILHDCGGYNIGTMTITKTAATVLRDLHRNGAGTYPADYTTSSPRIPVRVLNDIIDVDAASPSDGDLLAWNDSLGTWEPVPPAAGSGSVNGVESVSGTAGAVRVEDGVGGGGNIRIRRIIAGSGMTVSVDGNGDIQLDSSGGGVTEAFVIAMASAL